MEERRHEFWQETILCPEMCAYTQAAHNNHQHNASASTSTLTIHLLMDYEHIFKDRRKSCPKK